MKTSSKLFLILATAISLSGCRWYTPMSSDKGPNGPFAEHNPVQVPFVDRHLIMDEVSDELDNYFRIEHEQRIRLVDNVMTEGWIKTYPQIGSSIAEPWRKDSTPGYEKTLSTLQTIRRFAKVRIIPNQQGYSIDVKVYKELEDMPQPEHSTISGTLLRHDNTLDIFDDNPFGPPVNRGWIPLGRDFGLEEKILTNIRNRVKICCDKAAR